MSFLDQTNRGPQLRSAVPGRERWRVPSLHRNPKTARRVDTQLSLDPQVRSVTVNERTGSVLVLFDPGSGYDVGAQLRAALAFPAAEPPSPPAQNNEKHIGRLLARVGTDPRELRRATAVPVLAAVGAFVPNLLLAAVTNTARDNGSRLLTKIGIASVRNQLIFLGGTVIAAFALDIWLEYRSKARWLGLAAELESRIKLEAFDHVQRLDMAYIDEQSTGRLQDIIVDDAAALRKYYEEGYTDIVKKITSAVVINTLLLGVSPVLALSANLSLPLIYLASRYFKPRTAAVYREAGVAQGEFARALSDNLSGIPTIKSFTNEELEVERLSALNVKLNDANHDAFEARYAHSGSMRGLFYVSWASTVTQASYLLTADKLPRSVYSVLLFSVPQLIASMFGIDETTNLHRRANAAAERILDILDVETEVVDGGDDLTTRCTGELRFEQVHFGYTKAEPVLEGLDLELSPGLTAIVGGSGAGKSTIAKLLLRFFDVESGRVTLDGRDIRELTLRSLRSQISYVSQEPYLFPGSIEDNIRFGRPGASLDEIRQVAEAAEVSSFIESLPDGYQTRIGERGARLSGGQRQRLCIARALLKDAPIIIFDEATASIDNNTEYALMRSIAQFGDQRTILLIAHRLASVRWANRILVLEDGRVKESGTHEQLLEQRGLYASLWRVQAAEPQRKTTRI